LTEKEDDEKVVSLRIDSTYYRGFFLKYCRSDLDGIDIDFVRYDGDLIESSQDGYCGWYTDKEEPFCRVINVRGSTEI